MSQIKTGSVFEMYGSEYKLQKETFMNKKPSFKFSSHLLVSTLIATSFFMVNCNKGQNRTGVKANTTAGKPTDPLAKTTVVSGDVSKAQKLPAADCTESVLKSYGIVATEAKRVQELVEKNKTAASKEKFKAEYLKVLGLCDDLGKEFDQANLKSCKYKNSKNVNEDIVVNKAPSQCLIAAKQLFDEDGTKTDYLKLLNDQIELKKQEAAQKVSSAEAFKSAKLVMSNDMKKMLTAENLNFKMYIVGGEIKTAQAEMKKAYADKKVVCSFVGTSTEISEKEKSIFSVVSYEDVDKKDLPEGMSAAGIVFSVGSTENTDSVSNMQMLGCSNLLKDKIDVKLLRQALGQHLAPAEDVKKDESRVEAKVEAKAQPKTEPKVEPKVEVKAEPKVEAKSEPVQESKAVVSVTPVTEQVQKTETTEVATPPTVAPVQTQKSDSAAKTVEAKPATEKQPSIVERAWSKIKKIYSGSTDSEKTKVDSETQESTTDYSLLSM